MEKQILKSIYAKAIGELIVDYLDSTGCTEVFSVTEPKAIELITEVKAILNDDSLDDPQCFHRIDAIVNVFSANGMDTSRHDW